MHLHLHLKDTLMNFGPSHAFWCFPFERYNGLLGSYHTNRKSIETQVMKRFCLEQAVHSMDLPMENMFLQLLPVNSNDEDTIPTIDINTSLRALSLSVEQLDDISSFVLDKSVSPLPPYTEQILDAEYVELLSTLYSELYPDKMFSQILPCVQKYGRVTLFNEIIGSCLRGRNNKKSSVIMAYWPSSGATLRGNRHTGLSVGVVQYFIKHVVTVVQAPESNFHDIEHIFAYVHWKQKHPQSDWFGTSAIVCVDIDEPLSPSCFIPVQRIAFRCAHAVIPWPVDFNGIVETVFVACPMPIRFCT